MLSEAGDALAYLQVFLLDCFSMKPICGLSMQTFKSTCIPTMYHIAFRCPAAITSRIGVGQDHLWIAKSAANKGLQFDLSASSRRAVSYR